MPKAHKDGDPRVCGAVTVVVNQSNTYVDGRLWAVLGDPNSHGDGALINSFTGVNINGLPVIVHTPDSAEPDALCIPLNGSHCFPMTAGGSDVTYAYDG